MCIRDRYTASQCTQAADGSWTPNSGAAQLYARNEMRINGPNSSGSWDSHWAVPTSVPVGEKLVAIYSPSPDDVKTGTISGVSNAVQAVQDINTGGYTISAYDAVTNKTVAQAAAGKQYYADFVGTTPPMQKRIDYYTNLYVVEKNSQGQDVGTPVKLPYSAATGRWDAIPYEAAGKYLRMTVNCTNAQFFAHRGTLTLDIPIVDANTVTGQVTVKALQYADGNPRTGKKLTANYVKNGSNPDNGANGTWIWEVQAKGSSAWTAVSADLIFPLGAAGYDGSYIYVPESSLGGKYRAVSYTHLLELYRDDTNELIYKTGLLDPGSYVPEAKLDKFLEKGNYDCTAYIYAYKLDTEEYLGKVAAGVTVHVVE